VPGPPGAQATDRFRLGFRAGASRSPSSGYVTVPGANLAKSLRMRLGLSAHARLLASRRRATRRRDSPRVSSIPISVGGVLILSDGNGVDMMWLMYHQGSQPGKGLANHQCGQKTGES
jgi:hypothetical protein